MATDFTSQINAIYQAVEYRPAPAAELAVYNAALASGSMTLAQVQSAVINDPFTVNTVDVVIREYQAAFGRVPDQAGAAFWVSQIVANPATLVNLNTIFANSAEFTARFGATSTTTANSALVTAIYTQVYGRAPDAAGLAYWSNSGLNAAQLLQAFANAPEFVTLTTPAVQAYQNLEVAGTAPTTGSLFAVAPAGGGANLVLTTGIDLLTGTAANDTFIGDNTGTTATVSAADTLNGGSGTDTFRFFNLAATGLDTVVLPQLNSIEAIELNGGTLTNGATRDVSTLTGVTSLTLANTTAMVTGTAFTVKEASGSTLGLTNVSVATGGAATLNVNGASTIVANGVGSGTGVLTVDVTNTTTAALAIQATGAASKFTLANTGAALNTLNITGDKALTLTESVAGIKTVNASADTGGLTLDTSGVTLNAAFAFTGGSGNDNLILKNGNTSISALTSGAQLDGGAGKDTLTLNDIAWSATDYTHINAVKNFEVLALGTTGATLDASQVATFKEFAVSTGTEIINNVANGSILDITGGGTTTFSAAVGATTATINLGVAGAAGVTEAALTTTGFTNLTINTAGTSVDTITALHNADNSAITVTGSTDLTIGGIDATTTGSKIDATALTGKLNVIGSAQGDVIIGGSGADTIRGAQGADLLTGNAGADKFVFNWDVGFAAAGSDVAGSATGFKTVTDFKSGTDILNITHTGGTAETLATTAQEATIQTAVNALAAGSSDAAVIAAIAGSASANTVAYATFNGNTYVVVNDATAGFSSTGADATHNDIAIKLAGVAALTPATDFVIA